MQGFVRRFCFQRAGWTAVFEINDSACEFRPKFLGETCFREDRSNSSADDAVGPLCDSILLWSVGRRLFVLYAEFCAEFCHFLAVFPSTICSNGFDAPPILFEHIAKVEERIAHLFGRLWFERVEVHHTS